MKRGAGGDGEDRWKKNTGGGFRGGVYGGRGGKYQNCDASLKGDDVKQVR